MLEIVLRNLRHRKARTILTIMGVGMSVMLYVYMSHIMNWYDSNIQRTVGSFAGKVVVQQKTETTAAFPPIGSLLSNTDAARLLQRNDIEPSRSSAVLFETLVPTVLPNMPPTVLAVGITPGRESALIGNSAVDGQGVLVNSHAVILGAKAAAYYTKGVGDSLDLDGTTFTVVGVLQSVNELFDSMVMMPLATAQEHFKRRDVVTAVLLSARQIDTAAAVAEDINKGNFTATTSEAMERNAQDLLQAQRAFFTSLRGMMLTVSLFMVIIVMVIAVAERRKEIGTLKAMGASNRFVLSLILVESVVLTVAGGLMGMADVYIYALVRSEDMQIPADLALQTIGFAVLIGALAALWPARSALRVDPVESLRYE